MRKIPLRWLAIAPLLGQDSPEADAVRDKALAAIDDFLDRTAGRLT